MQKDMASWNDRREWVDEAVRAWVDQFDPSGSEGLAGLKRSIEYSLVRGGKRFRPLVCLLIGECFATGPRKILPWAVAIEMIHTYSLIHDDLPCMDDDDERRGEPTNHKVFGQATALLSGDALLTEAFGAVAVAYDGDPVLASGLIRLLVEAAGIRGMVGGQAIDIVSQKERLGLGELVLMHEMKTGALIRACCEGSALICGLPEAKRKYMREFGSLLGFAFQLKDDLLDSAEGPEEGSLAAALGLEETERRLQQVSAHARGILTELGIGECPLRDLVQMNLDRTG